MRRPAVFFDRDNTLIVGNDYLGDPAGVVLVIGAAAAVATCRHLGFAVVVVSNQSGVARGMFTEADVAAVNARTDALLLAANPAAVVDRHEYCPHHPDGSVEAYRTDCDCRKPKPGMIHAAAEAMALDLPASWLIGDAPRDVAAGRAAGCRTILIIDPTLPPSPAALATMDVPAEFVVGSIVEAAEVVAQQSARSPKPETAEPIRDREPSLGKSAAVNTSVATPRPAEAVEREAGPVAPHPLPITRALERATEPTAKPADPKPRAGPVANPTPTIDLSRLEVASQQILMELKKLNDTRHDDFSISKLIAGIVQTLALAALPLAYVLYRNDAAVFEAWLLTALFLQTFTVALLVMGRQR